MGGISESYMWEGFLGTICGRYFWVVYVGGISAAHCIMTLYSSELNSSIILIALLLWVIITLCMQICSSLSQTRLNSVDIKLQSHLNTQVYILISIPEMLYDHYYFPPRDPS